MSFLPALFLSLSAFASGAKPPEAELYCQGKEEARSRPVLQLEAEGGKLLFLCAAEKRRGAGGKGPLVQGFRVFALGKGGAAKAKLVLERKRGEFQAIVEGRELVLKELLTLGAEALPVLENRIACTAAGCQGSAEPRCLLEAGRSIAAGNAWRELERYLGGKQKGKVPPRKLIDRVARLALSGDARALSFFRDRGSLVLDGEASDAYFDFQEELARLRKAGCP